mgnify:CR=1 FL=1
MRNNTSKYWCAEEALPVWSMIRPLPEDANELRVKRARTRAFSYIKVCPDSYTESRLQQSIRCQLR